MNNLVQQGKILGFDLVWRYLRMCNSADGLVSTTMSAHGRQLDLKINIYTIVLIEADKNSVL